MERRFEREFKGDAKKLKDKDKMDKRFETPILNELYLHQVEIFALISVHTFDWEKKSFYTDRLKNHWRLYNK